MRYSSIYIFSTLILLFMIQTLYGDDFYLVSTGRKADAVDHDIYGRTWMSPKEMKLWGKYRYVEARGTYGMTDQTPFYTAVLSDTLFSFRFPIKVPGRKYVRLYFYTHNYDLHFYITDANFSVIANSSVLIAFPKPRLYSLDSATSLVVEFSLPVLSDHLTLLFAPNYGNRVAFAFINGIEIVSHPDIYSGTATLVGKVKGRKFVIDKRSSLETITRLNVGGEQINILDDSGRLFRLWDTDERFIKSEDPGIGVDASAWDTVLAYPPRNFSAHVAPRLVYRTARVKRPGDSIYYRMTWRFPVDPKYNYFIRLHFCEVVSSYTVNDRVFNIHINGYLTERGADVVAWTGKPGVPIYKDYVVFVPNSAEPEVRIVLTPDLSSHTKHYDTLLNGIEIFKISDCNGYLDENYDLEPQFGMPKPPKKC